MEKKPRKKKVLNLDLEVKETATPKAKKPVELDPSLTYEFIGNGNFRTLPKGSVWKINGELASKFISKGYGNLK
jgi:hypothetical protein